MCNLQLNRFLFIKCALHTSHDQHQGPERTVHGDDVRRHSLLRYAVPMDAPMTL